MNNNRATNFRQAEKMKTTRAPGAGRPPIHTGPLGGPTRAVSLTLPVALVERLDRIANDAVATRSYVITTLLIDHFER